METNEISPIIQTPSTPILQGKGYFTVGSTAVFFFDFPDINGQRYDPVNLQAIIKDPNDQEFDAITDFDKLEMGKYALSWPIPSTDPNGDTIEEGTFTIYLTFTAETTDGPMDLSLTESFIVGGRGTQVIPNRMIGARSYLESLIGYFTRIPVFHEIGRLNQARNIAEFSFPRWNPSRTKVYINGDTKEDGYYVNYIDGKVVLDHALSSTDEIFASYTFRWFEDEELYTFIAQAIQVFNQYPPHTTYDINNLEDRYVVTAVKQAAVDAIRRLMMDLMLQEPAKVFGGMDRADKLISTLDSTKRNYEDELNKLYEAKKYGPYLGLTRTITVPEFTLPGGRCLANNTRVNVLCGDNTYDFIGTYNNLYIQEIDLDTLYEKHVQNQKILIQTQLPDESIGFALISKMWESGTKEVFILATESSSIEASNDHLFYIVGKGYVPLKYIVNGDTVLLAETNRVIEEQVKYIKYNGEKRTYDIEVPMTENLFANKIKCHNSRWFRYLFKS